MTEQKILCPFCHKGEVYAEGTGDVSVTLMCPKCSRCFRVHLNDFSTELVVPRKKIRKMVGTFHPR